MRNKILNYTAKVFPAVHTIVLGAIFVFFIYTIVNPNISAHSTPNFHRIRQDDGIVVYKFQDGIADCYVAANEWIHNTSQTSPSISCVKR
jgi:hypothetical protein